MDKSSQIATRLKVRLLPALIGLLLVMQLIDPYRGWVILLVGLGGTWLACYLWARSLARGLHLERQMRFGWAQVGDQLEERFTLVNTGWAAAVWVEVVDHSTLPDYAGGRVTAVGARSANRWSTKGICTRRGLFSLGPTSLLTGDPLGIFEVRLHHPAWTDLMVTPPAVALPTIQVAPGGRAGEGRPRSYAPEWTVSAAGVRDYAPGDSVSWIHWPTSARHDSLLVRQWDSTPTGDWWLVLDANQQVQAGSGWDSTIEHGVILAASLADRGLRDGKAVGLMAFGRELVWLPPQGGDGQRLRVLRALALAEAGTRPLADLLARTDHAIGRWASLVIITPDTGGVWLEALLPLMQRGSTPTVLLLDPTSFDDTAPPAAGLARQLTRWGIAHTVVSRDLLDQPEARPGRMGHWEWRTSATGRALPTRQPVDTTWRELA